MEERKQKKQVPVWVWIVIFLLLIPMLILFLYHTGFFQSIDSLEHVRAYIEHFSPYSYVIYFLIQFASVVIAPIPSNVTSLAGAAMFGTIPAFLLTYGAVVLGAALVFQLAKLLGRPFVERFVSRRNVDKYLKIIERKQDVFFMMAFLLPGFPDDILCFLAGLTTMDFRRFMLLVLTCRPWGLLLSCAVGGNALSLPMPVLGLLCLAGLVLFLIAMKYGDRWEERLIDKLSNSK